MIRFRIRSLQRRFVILMLVPVAALLLAMGAVGFTFSINTLVEQWEEAAVLRLQRAAHQVDMRLQQPKEWIRLYRSATGGPVEMQLRGEILKKLRETEGVIDARVVMFQGQRGPSLVPSAPGTAQEAPDRAAMHHMAGTMARGPEQEVTISEPAYDDVNESGTVSLTARIADTEGTPLGEIQATIDFQHLLRGQIFTEWWKSQQFYLVDASGKILTGPRSRADTRIGDNGDPLEKRTLEMIRQHAFGTVRGGGHPPDRVAGFSRLMEAPWYFVVFAPGREILQPLITFGKYYFSGLLAFILVILLLIRNVSRKTAVSIREISRAADRIARGRFGPPLPVVSEDEIGNLTNSFNCMVLQLRERLSMKQDLDLAKEVQQQLLPQAAPVIDGLDIAGSSRYCDETGGDLYDYLFHPQSSRVHLIVGDVTGHGIPSALLMSTTRASLRQRFDKPGDLGDIISDVNRQIVNDVGDTGRFVTLFHMAVDPSHREIRWVRAGHDPAIFLHKKTGAHETLNGGGLALGVDAGHVYREQRKSDIAPGDILLIGTDGLWEAQNAEGEMFGKQRLIDCIRTNSDETATVIVTRIFAQIDAFTDGQDQADDMTLIVVKIQDRFDNEIEIR